MPTNTNTKQETTVYDIKIIGGGTREEMAEALRLIATALDGKGEYPSQSDENIDGAEWNDCHLQTDTFKATS
jgi:hypothetical protein